MRWSMGLEHIAEDESLRIVPQAVWDLTVVPWEEIERTWPRRPGRRGFEGQQRSYVDTHPPHLLSGTLRCAVCTGANRLLVPRRLTERKVLESLRQACSTPVAIRTVLEHVEAKVQQLHAHIPEQIELKRADLVDEER